MKCILTTMVVIIGLCMIHTRPGRLLCVFQHLKQSGECTLYCMQSYSVRVLSLIEHFNLERCVNRYTTDIAEHKRMRKQTCHTFTSITNC